MGLLRSDDMVFAQLVLPPQEAKKYIEAIGLNETCNVQFEDTFAQTHAHSGMHRPYLKPLQRVKELERILRTFTDMNSGLVARYSPHSPIVTGYIDNYLKRVKGVENPYSLDSIERELKSFDTKLCAQLALNDALAWETELAKEELDVVKRAVSLLDDSSALGTPLLHLLNSIAGVITAPDLPKLKRSIWRASRGKAFVDAKEIDNGKSVFVVYFQGAGEGSEGALMGKVRRLCQNSSANLFSWPGSKTEALDQKDVKENQIRDNEALLKDFKSKVEVELRDMLKPIDTDYGDNSNSKIEDYRLFCIQQKSTFAILNLFESSTRNMRCNIWYSADPVEKQVLEDTLKGVAAKEPAVLVPDLDPVKGFTVPTYIKTNDFTEPWQAVVDTYGVPNYKTANPAMVTTITFPFVFGMMYGDIGHGTILFLAGVWMCWNGHKYKYSSGYANLIHWARYMVLMMGFFAVFAGFMYNDLFGMVSFDFFGTRWLSDGEPRAGFNTKNLPGSLNASAVLDGQAVPFPDDPWSSGPYPFGLDPAWSRATNGLIFNNSLKMKLSVCIGVLQMLLGVFFKFANSIYDGKKVDFFFECIPMLIFMVCFFGYMDYMIVYKWTHNIDPQYGAPGIINALICMAMHKADPPQMYPGATSTESMLMLATAIAVPWLLIPKPIILWFQDRSKKNGKKAAACAALKDNTAELEKALEAVTEDDEFNFSEILIHQIIETIEYVLGTVSHTASYLRVWALSLAHQQLSLVFYTKTIQMAFAMCSTLGAPAGGVLMYFLFGAWFTITCAVLLAMDVLECFLHTLRLHWVEFQSKFYTGKNEGIKFAPYNIILILTSAE